MVPSSVSRRIFKAWPVRGLHRSAMAGWRDDEFSCSSWSVSFRSRRRTGWRCTPRGTATAACKRKSESQRVRLVGRQVFDKLLNAKLLLGNFPPNSVDGANLPGIGVVFASASFCGGCEDSTNPLVVAWNSAAQPANAVTAISRQGIVQPRCGHAVSAGRQCVADIDGHVARRLTGCGL